MKNIVLKSLVVFVVMSLLNIQFAELIVKFLHLSGEGYKMLSFFMALICAIITLIGVVTVLVFKKSYNSILKIAILFEVIYLFTLIISGGNPFLYFSDPTNDNLFGILMYGNSFVVFLIMFLFDLLYSKIISTKIEN